MILWVLLALFGIALPYFPKLVIQIIGLLIVSVAGYFIVKALEKKGYFQTAFIVALLYACIPIVIMYGLVLEWM